MIYTNWNSPSKEYDPIIEKLLTQYPQIQVKQLQHRRLSIDLEDESWQAQFWLLKDSLQLTQETPSLENPANAPILLELTSL